MRATVIAAARALAERDGVENVTLGKVATACGATRTAVMGQFARREDLLMSIVSEDLAALARGMEGVAWPEGGETPEAAVPLPAVAAPEIAEIVEPPVETPDAAKDAAPAAPRQRLARRGDLAQMLEGKGEEPARADAWLERRLRVFERAMSQMEARQAEVEKSSRTAVATAEEAVKALEATIAELRARVDAADAKAKAAANEVRTALNETALRLQTVESVARAALAENTREGAAEPPAPEPVAAEVAPPAPSDTASPATPEPAAVETPTEDEPKSFIAGVRKSVVAATAAAAAAQNDAKAEAAARSQKGRKNITRYLLGGLIVLVIFVAAAGMAFSKGVNDGRRDALTHVVRLAPAAHTAPAETPLDQLTARARRGDAVAELQVALRYLAAGHRDPAQALRWTSLAAVHGHPVAQYLLGTLYAQGTGTAADAARALQWYEAAALQGNRKAMHALAVAYAEGLGTAKSPSESVRWFSRAAGFGYVDAQFNLAVLYERGAGVPQSLLDAYKWYAVAGRQGDAEAQLRIEALRSQLGSDDLAAAEHAARAFHATPYDVAANVAP